ncbi:MAG: cell division protein FtsI/penicillin-binding protein 2 [Planctomycetota bacterium]|jgi:cell division protein FtsI/penicillin-binding protein 2
MIAGRRFTPLILCVIVAFFGLVVRLYQVQIEEYTIWAREAANMVRKSQTIPYLRGRILDRNGDPFVQDEEAYAVRFVYRDFRRNHPLGQITHARGALENQSVSLQAAALELEAWGLLLVEQRAEDIDRFARGDAVELCGIQFPAVEGGTDRRRARAAELRFYTRGLLIASKRDWHEIKKKLKKGRELDSTWLELVASQEGSSVEIVRERVRTRITRSMQRLQQLAIQIEVRSLDGLMAVTGEDSLWFLIDGLEVKRYEIESAIAKDLFEEATGFEPGRIRPMMLLEMIDLSFIAAELNWDMERMGDWALAMRRQWVEDRRSFHVPRAAIQAGLRASEGEDSLDAFLGELGVLFSSKPRTPRERREASRDWHRIPDAAVFEELPDLFERADSARGTHMPLGFLGKTWRDARSAGVSREDLAAGMLPLDFAARVASEHPPQPVLDWRGVLQEPWVPPADHEDAVARLLWLLYPQEATDYQTDPSHARDEDELVNWVQDLWESRFQSELHEIFSDLKRKALAKEFVLPLVLSEKRVGRASKKADYFIRDRGSRPEVIDDSPDDHVINTLTRYVDEYRGFEVQPRTRRLAMALDEDDRLVARELIGVVRESTLEEVLKQQPERSVFSNILSKKDRSREDALLLKEVHSRLYRSDEVHGTSGVEGLMDNVLRGTNGFSESEGLQQRAEGTRSKLFKEKVDGLDVELTLSLDLQSAAQRIIEHPSPPVTGESFFDNHWFRNPVGAIVLATVDGEILAAASCPKEPHEPSPARDGERAYNYERTLRMPLFQPVGSIFKPFVAAYALSHSGLDPLHELECVPRDSGGGAGWGKVACHNSFGHGSISLAEAMQRSCNSYFAQVGEMLQSKENVRNLAHMFGFDRPTGVRDIGTGRGLVEVHSIRKLNESGGFSATDLHRAGNGLVVLEATPVQVARAVAGIATGYLPAMRLVRRVGDTEIPATFEKVPLPEHNLQIVRDAMVRVINHGNFGVKRLSAEKLGFQIAGKTGSADYRAMTPAYLRELDVPAGKEPQMRKHTWFIGFFPAQNPTNVVVVYCHDIGVTASHSAAYVAAQFLTSPAVQAYVQGALK